MDGVQGHRLQDHFDHGVGRQGTVQLVELLAAGGCNGDGYTEVLTRAALAQLYGGGIKIGVKVFGYCGDRVHQTLLFDAHHLDGKAGWIFDQGVRWRTACGGDLWGGGHAQIIAVRAILHKLWAEVLGHHRVSTYNQRLHYSSAGL
jgi:hypothetical protein